MIYRVTSLAYDPSAGKAYYTADNYAFRDLMEVDVASGKSRTLLRDARIGDIVVNPRDKAIWGLRHLNGFVTLVKLAPPYSGWTQIHTFAYGHRLRPPEAHELAPPDSGPGEGARPPTTYRPPTGEPARWSEIDVLSDRELEDTFTPRLLVLPRSDLPADAPAVPDRDPFDAYRRWDESG